jgi:hypothetical protein
VPPSPPAEPLGGTWSLAVESFADLPAAGNRRGDVRLVADSHTIYGWEAGEWAPLSSGGGTTGEFADTFQPMKLIGLSNGDTIAIPAGANAPATPTGLDTTARLSSVRVAWDAAARAARYVLYRTPGGVLSEQITATSYRDLAVSVGSTYQYYVQAVDQYGQRSQIAGPDTAFIDPALNVAPTVTVKAWPPSAPSNGRTYLRVNARDANAQALALALEVDAGTITATPDPSVWIYTP